MKAIMKKLPAAVSVWFIPFSFPKIAVLKNLMRKYMACYKVKEKNLQSQIALAVSSDLER